MKQLRRKQIEMRKEVKALWDEIQNPYNKDRLFDYISLLANIMNGNITNEELTELKQYARN